MTFPKTTTPLLTAFVASTLKCKANSDDVQKVKESGIARSFGC
jgi:hypothetical protein